jgi:hypothetical protein
LKYIIKKNETALIIPLFIRTACPQGCRTGEGTATKLRPLHHIPYDPDLFYEFNVERFEFGKTGKLLFNNPQGTHVDRFWDTVFAVYATEQAPLLPSRPIARTV